MKEMYQKMLACVRSMSLYYQHIHWVSKNSLSFQDHLLAERLYGAVSSEVDPIAEKAMGITKDAGSVDLLLNIQMIHDKLKTIPMSAKDNGDLFKAALSMEQEFISCCTQYEKTPGVTLGVKNLLADMADHAEGRVYLLQQRLSISAAPVAVVAAPINK